jgi:hypothetical protein
MAKYMLIMRGTDESNAAVMAGFEELAASTYQFIEELMKAGVFIAAEGLDDAAESVVVDFGGEAPVVTDGPYGETKELFGIFHARCRVEAGGGRVGQAAAVGHRLEDRGTPGSRRGRTPTRPRGLHRGRRAGRE